MDDNTIEIHFMHPRNSAMTLTADISPQCTGQEALQALMLDEDGKGAFLPALAEGQVYELAIRRPGQSATISPNMTFAQAGALNGDTVDVRQSATGAAKPVA
jgi:hypothetical protein